MKVLHIIKSKRTKLIEKIIESQAKKNKVKVIDLREKNKSYKVIIDEIFTHDKVISW